MQFTYPSMRKGHDLFGRWRKESDPPTSDVRDLTPGRPRVVDYSNFVGRPDDSSRTGCPLPSVDPELLGQVSKRRQTQPDRRAVVGLEPHRGREQRLQRLTAS